MGECSRSNISEGSTRVGARSRTRYLGADGWQNQGICSVRRLVLDREMKRDIGEDVEVRE